MWIVWSLIMRESYIAVDPEHFQLLDLIVLVQALHDVLVKQVHFSPDAVIGLLVGLKPFAIVIGFEVAEKLEYGWVNCHDSRILKFRGSDTSVVVVF